MPTKEEFLQGVKDLNIDVDDIVDGKRAYRSYSKPERVKVPHLYVEWRSGGTGGGSYQDTGDTDNHYSISSDPEPDFEALDQVLAKYCKNISFIQYKVLMKKLIKRGEYSNNEYYGNHSDYATKYINVTELYEYLRSEALFT